LIMKDTHKFTSIPSISLAKMEEKKSPKLSIKEKLSIKSYSIPPLKTKSLPSQIKALKTGNYKKIPHQSLMNLPKSTNFKIFTLILITNHTRSVLKPITFYVGKNHNNAQSITSLLKKLNVFWKSMKHKFVFFWRPLPADKIYDLEKDCEVAKKAVLKF